MTKRRLFMPTCAVLAAMTSLAACGGEEVVQNTIREDATMPPSGADVPVLPEPEPTEDNGQGATPDAQASAAGALPPPGAFRFVGLWATEADLCADTAWRFTRESLETPAGSVCKFVNATPISGGYDISARCTSEGPPVDDMLKIRFAESAQAMLFEAESIADAGLIYCGALDGAE